MRQSPDEGQVLTLHRAGKLMKGLLTEAWESRTRSVISLCPTTFPRNPTVASIP
jgi:hypothetical protein